MPVRLVLTIAQPPLSDNRMGNTLHTQTASTILLDEIESLGCDTIFLVPGANISSFVAQSQNRKTIDLVIANHELAAGFMALGYAKANGRPGVVCSIGGPGIAYLAGAAVAAAAEQVPLLFVSGNIPRDSWGRGFFQDGSAQGTNDVALFRQAIGCSCECSDVSMMGDALVVLRERLSCRRPAHIQLPIDVQSASCGPWPREAPAIPPQPASLSPLPSVANGGHQKTLLLIGQEAADTIDSELLQRAVARRAFGVVTDIKSRGILDERCANSQGFIGFNSSPSALSALDVDSHLAADRVFDIGLASALRARYVDRSMPLSKIDADAANAWLHGLAGEDTGPSGQSESSQQWLKELRQLSAYAPVVPAPAGRLLYSDMLDACQRVLPEDTIYCLDSGQIRRAGNMMIKARNRQTIVQSDTLSPMGMGLCAAIGAKVAVPHRPVVALFGDGSMRMHGIELSTAQRYRLPVIFVLCDNESLASTPGNAALKKLPAVRWDEFAGSFGIRTHFSADRQTFTQHLLMAMRSSGPTLLWTRVPDLLDDEIDIVSGRADKSWLSKFQK